MLLAWLIGRETRRITTDKVMHTYRVQRKKGKTHRKGKTEGGENAKHAEFQFVHQRRRVSPQKDSQ